MLCCTDEHLDNQDAQIRLLLDRMVDGLIVARVGDSANFKKLFDGANVPVVLIDRVCEGVDTDAVVLDNRRAVFDAITYLTNLGHRRIGYISGSFAISPMPDRFAGYREALQAAGIAFEDQLVQLANFHEADGYNAAMQLLSLPERERDLLGQQPMVINHEGDPRPRPVLPGGRLGRLLRHFPGLTCSAAAHHCAPAGRRSATGRQFDVSRLSGNADAAPAGWCCRAGWWCATRAGPCGDDGWRRLEEEFTCEIAGGLVEPGPYAGRHKANVRLADCQCNINPPPGATCHPSAKVRANRSPST